MAMIRFHAAVHATTVPATPARTERSLAKASAWRRQGHRATLFRPIRNARGQANPAAACYPQQGGACDEAFCS